MIEDKLLEYIDQFDLSIFILITISCISAYFKDHAYSAQCYTFLFALLSRRMDFLSVSIDAFGQKGFKKFGWRKMNPVLKVAYFFSIDLRYVSYHYLEMKHKINKNKVLPHVLKILLSNIWWKSVFYNIFKVGIYRVEHRISLKNYINEKNAQALCDIWVVIRLRIAQI